MTWHSSLVRLGSSFKKSMVVRFVSGRFRHEALAQAPHGDAHMRQRPPNNDGCSGSFASRSPRRSATARPQLPDNEHIAANWRCVPKAVVAPLREHRKRIRRCQNRGLTQLPGSARRMS